MGLPGECTEAHATGAEAGADAFHALHLIQGQRRRSQLELEQIAEGRDRTVLQQGLVGREVVVTGTGLDRRMERLGHLGAVEVILATGAVLHETHELELAAVQLGESLGVQRQGFIRQLGQGHARHTTGSTGEGGIDHVGTEADGLENLCAVVARQQ